MRFPTADLARSTSTLIKQEASKLGVDLALEYDARTEYITRGMVTALALGACRAVRLVLRQNQLKQIIEYHKIFRLFGRLHAIRPQVRYAFRLLLPDTVLNEGQNIEKRRSL